MNSIAQRRPDCVAPSESVPRRPRLCGSTVQDGLRNATEGVVKRTPKEDMLAALENSNTSAPKQPESAGRRSGACTGASWTQQDNTHLGTKSTGIPDHPMSETCSIRSEKL